MVEVQNRREDVDDCVNPEVDDPESWECECLEDMRADCALPKHPGMNKLMQTLDPKLPLESCLRIIMCKKETICQSWRDQHCEDSMVDVSATGALYCLSWGLLLGKNSRLCWLKSF